MGEQGNSKEKELSLEKAKPAVEMVGKFRTEATPYDISVDVEELGRIMREHFRLPDTEIRKLHIKFLAADEPWENMANSESGKKSLEKLQNKGKYVLFGNTDKYIVDGKRSIGVHTGTIFKEEHEFIQMVIDSYFALPSVDNKKFLEKIFVSKRIANYLDKAEPERAKKFLENLSQYRSEREIELTLAHEIEHGAQMYQDSQESKDPHTNTKRIILNAVTAGVVTGILAVVAAGVHMPPDKIAKMASLVYLGSTVGANISEIIKAKLKFNQNEIDAEQKAVDMARGKEIDLMASAISIKVYPELLSKTTS